MKIHCCTTVSTSGILASNIKRWLLGHPLSVTIRLLGHVYMWQLSYWDTLYMWQLDYWDVLYWQLDYWDTLYIWQLDYWDTLYMWQLDYWGELMRLDGMGRWSNKLTSLLSLILTWLRLRMQIGLGLYIITNLQTQWRFSVSWQGFNNEMEDVSGTSSLKHQRYHLLPTLHKHHTLQLTREL
jgi:hypothetical protein